MNYELMWTKLKDRIVTGSVDGYDQISHEDVLEIMKEIETECRG